MVQDAIGGAEWIWEVCEPCNFGMKDIDKNLAVRSPLSILAIRELGETGPRTWVHDPQNPGLLLEARGAEGTDSLIQFPQIVFDGDGSRMYCDAEEVRRLGPDAVRRDFYARLRGAYDHYLRFGPMAKRKYHKKKDMLKIQRVERRLAGERFPPRIFCRTQVSEFKPGLTFELRFHHDGDDRKVLDKLSTFNWNPNGTRAELIMGAEDGTVHLPFSVTDGLRAISKVGFNLLAFHCQQTPVSLDTFQRTVEWIKDCRHVAEFGNVQKYGFVHPADIAPLGCPAKAHKFRLTHDLSTDTWKMYAAFFGGKAGAYVAFRGPNRETWATMDVVVPYEEPLNPAVFDNWYRPLDVRVTMNPTEMVPSVLWTKGVLEIHRTPTDQ